MKKNLMEILLFFELEQDELAISRIRSLESKYAPLFEDDLYSRVKTFLLLIKEVILYPDRAQTETFADRVERPFDWVSTEEEDIQAIGFYAWLKSKMLGREYHEVLVELVK